MEEIRESLNTNPLKAFATEQTTDIPTASFQDAQSPGSNKGPTRFSEGIEMPSLKQILIGIAIVLTVVIFVWMIYKKYKAKEEIPHTIPQDCGKPNIPINSPNPPVKEDTKTLLEKLAELQEDEAQPLQTIKEEQEDLESQTSPASSDNHEDDECSEESEHKSESDNGEDSEEDGEEAGLHVNEESDCESETGLAVHIDE